MAEPLVPMRAMHTIPISGTQPVHVAIKQAAAVCSQTPLKFSVDRPPASKSQSLWWQDSPESQVFKQCSIFLATTKSKQNKTKQKNQKTSLKGAAASHQMKKKVAKLCFCVCTEFLSKPSQVLHGISPPHWHANL